MQRLQLRRPISLLAALLCVTAVTFVDAADAAAAKVTICHRTHSTTNPYRRISVSQNAITRNNGHSNHADPVFDPTYTYPANAKLWGDIIPDATAGGSNSIKQHFADRGLAIYDGTTYLGYDHAGLCKRMTALEFYQSEIAAGETEANVLADLEEQQANEDYALKQSLGGSFTGASVESLSQVSAATQAATSITDTTATLNGTLTVGSTPTNTSFEWGTSPTLTGATTTTASPSSVTNTTPVLLNLTGLTPGTTYYFRVVGTTNAGTDLEGQIYGLILSFTTPAAGQSTTTTTTTVPETTTTTTTTTVPETTTTTTTIPETTTTTTTAPPSSGAPTACIDDTLGAMQVSVPYADAVAADGTPSPTYAVSSGSLPDGLSLDSATGAVTGTPLTAGPWVFEITATNEHGSHTCAFSLTVAAAPTEPGSTTTVPATTTTTTEPATTTTTVPETTTTTTVPETTTTTTQPATTTTIPETTTTQPVTTTPSPTTTQPVAPATNPVTARVRGVVWIDLNRNGVQDANEPGMPNTPVRLEQTLALASSVRTAALARVKPMANAGSYSTVTDALGRYAFENVTPGSWVLKATLTTDTLSQTFDSGGASQDWVVPVSVLANQEAVGDFAAAGSARLEGSLTTSLGEIIEDGEGVVTWAGPDGIIGTDDDVDFPVKIKGGKFLLDGIPTGPYTVSGKSSDGRVAENASVAVKQGTNKAKLVVAEQDELPNTGRDVTALLVLGSLLTLGGVLTLRRRSA